MSSDPGLMEESGIPPAQAVKRLRTPAWLGELWRGTALAVGLLVVFFLALSGLRPLTDPSALHAGLSPEIASSGGRTARRYRSAAEPDLRQWPHHERHSA
jgi:hypothetical protein